MPSLALIIHLADGYTGPVSAEAARKAAAWCEYLSSHAIRVYSVCINPDILIAHELAAKITARKIPDGSTIRELSRPFHRGLG